MKKLILPSVVVAGAMILASCGSTPVMYNWYGYTDATYQYVKTGDEKTTETLLEVYQKIVDGQEGSIRGTIPPGVCADYGYMLVTAGKVEEGKEMLLKEKELYPESTAFVDSILKRIK